MLLAETHARRIEYTPMARGKREPRARSARVVLVDDHPIVREGLAQVINQKPDLAVCGEADNAADALAVIEAARPDVAIVDLALKDSSGLDLIKDIAIRFPKLSVLVLSMRSESVYAERALRAGAHGYVTKDEGTTKVIEGIRKVLDGEIYLSEEMSAKVLKAMLPGRRGSPGSKMDRLSDRELEVLDMIGIGLATSEIAEKLHLSVKTIETYRERIKEKLDLDTASELLKYAIRWARSREGA